MSTNKNNEKAEWINNMTRELEGFEEGLKEEIHIDFLKMTQKISNWKTPGHDGIHGFWFKIFTSIHDRLVVKVNKCLLRAQCPNGWQKEGPRWSKRTQAKEHL